MGGVPGQDVASLCIETCGYAVLNAVNSAYKEIPWRYGVLCLDPWWFIWEVQAQIRRIFLDGYDVLSQLAILDENVSQEDLNIKFLRSLPSEWNTHVVVWRNKAYLDTMSIDDLYNNFKIIEQEVKRTVTTSSNLGSQNMTFLLSPSSTNEVDTDNIQVGTVSTPVITVSSHDNTANLSDATVYAFLANQPNGSQLVHKDLDQIHEGNLEEMDLKWQLALLSMRARRECRSLKNQESRPRYQDSSRKTINVEDTSFKAMVAINGAGFDWSFMADDEAPTNMALMAFSDSETGLRFTSYNAVAPPPIGLFALLTIDLSNSGLEEFQHPEFEGYGPKASKSVCVDTSNEIKTAPDAPIIKD
nr:hypothetical protein [Tanacetum cinerariifolium]